MRWWLGCVVVSAAMAQTAPKVERGIAYAEPRNERQLLDVYAPATGAGHPVVVWVHGGGWTRGSKDAVDEKPAVFTSKGYVFVPMNYRYLPDVTMGDLVRDVAKAVGWVHANVAKYGGDPNRLLLMGHSAGAQVAALLCTDSRYVEAMGVPHESIKACVPLDGDTYDVPLQVSMTTARLKRDKLPTPKMGHPEKFGTLAQQREYSAVYHVAANRGIPPFLLIHVAETVDTSAQAYRLWAALDGAGVEARIFGAVGSEHVKLNRDIGTPGDATTVAIFEFLGKVLR